MEFIKELLSLNESTEKKWEVPFYIRCSEVSDTDFKNFEAAVKPHLQDDLRYDDLMDDEVALLMNDEDEEITHELGGTIIVDAKTETEAMTAAEKIVSTAVDKTNIHSDEYGVRIDGAYEKE